MNYKQEYVDSIMHKIPNSVKLKPWVRHEEKWSKRDTLEFNSVYGDEDCSKSCNECGAYTDYEYCQLCRSAME